MSMSKLNVNVKLNVKRAHGRIYSRYLEVLLYFEEMTRNMNGGKQIFPILLFFFITNKHS